MQKIGYIGLGLMGKSMAQHFKIWIASSSV